MIFSYSHARQIVHNAAAMGLIRYPSEHANGSRPGPKANYSFSVVVSQHQRQLIEEAARIHSEKPNIWIRKVVLEVAERTIN